MPLYTPLTEAQLQRLDRKSREIKSLQYTVYETALHLSTSPGDEDGVERSAASMRRVVQQLDRELFSLMELCGLLRRENYPKPAGEALGEARPRAAKIEDL